MANITKNMQRKLYKPGTLQGHVMYRTQGGEDFYAMLGVTANTSGQVGAFTAGERLAGLAHSDVQLRDYSDAAAADESYNVKVFQMGVLMCAPSGAAFDDINRAVFMSDNNTFTFTPVKGGYLGQSKFWDLGEDKLAVELNPGSEVWTSWFDIAADATLDIAGPAMLNVRAGDVAGIVAVAANGTYTVFVDTTNGIGTGTSPADAILTSTVSGKLRMQNKTGDAIRLVVQYLGTQL